MAGAPGFLSLRRQRETAEARVQLLVGIRRLDKAVELATDLLPERLLEIVPDDKDHFAESGANTVVNGIVDNGLAVGADRVDLLEPAVAGP